MIKVLPTTYSKDTKEIIKSMFQLKDSLSDVALDNYINNMTKIDIMDAYINWHNNKITSQIIFESIAQAFKFSLELVPVLTTEKLSTFELPFPKNREASSMPSSETILDLYLDHHHYKVTGTEVRTMINHFFGMNLVGIASLGTSRISLFSKNQWLVKNEKDLFVIHTGIRDVDVKIYTTSYFVKQTGSKDLPAELKQSLTQIGFSYNEAISNYYFINPSGQSVSNAFKGQTIGAINAVTNELYNHL